MDLPGFTATASLHPKRNIYRANCTQRVGGSGAYLVIQMRMAERRSIVCDIQYDACIDRCDNQICRFDDVGDMCGGCYASCEESDAICRTVFEGSSDSPLSGTQRIPDVILSKAAAQL